MYFGRGQPIESRIKIMIYCTAPFSMTLNDPYPGFQVTTFFDAEYLRNGTRYIVLMEY